MFGINLADFAARVSEVYFSIPFIHFLDDGFFFLYGPLLFFYTQGVVFKDFTWRKSDLLHLIPFAVVFIFILWYLITIDVESQRQYLTGIAEGEYPFWMVIISLLMYFHLFCYLFFSWRTITRYRIILKDKYSSIDEINLDWLRFMIRTFFIITLVGLVNSMVPVFGSIYFLYGSVFVLLILSFYFINRVVVKALNQPAIFSGIKKGEVEKYAGSTLVEEEVLSHANRLAKLMESEQPYLQSDLKSKDLAAMLDISTKELSQVINQGFNQNFFDFVNTYRCEEVKQILKGPDKKITVLEAMYQAGFNTKSSFNKEFKKLTGQTPGEYKKANQ
jgi:AraC-like DNA-binding protein